MQEHPDVTLSDLIEAALEQRLTFNAADESPEFIAWMRREVAVGAEQAERQEFSTLTLNEIKAELQSGATYEVWSPFHSHETAHKEVAELLELERSTNA